jgi:quercetin dioxygenase-like cupin family protein
MQMWRRRGHCRSLQLFQRRRLARPSAADHCIQRLGSVSAGANPEEKLMMKVLAIACVIAPAIVASAVAQPAGIKRTVLRTIDFPAGYTTVTAIVELAPGSCSGRHTHPGIDTGFVIQGDFVLKMDGKPEQTFKAGDSFATSPLAPHDGCSASGAKLVDTWVIEKGKPLASPAP